MDYLVLGPVEVVKDNQRVPVGGLKQRTVLAHLIANANRPVSVEKIIQGTWGDDAGPRVRRSLHTYVSNLRGELGDRIQHQGDAYRLDVDRGHLDSTRFEDLTSEGVLSLDSDPESASKHLQLALSLWRGNPYADVDGRGEFEAEITRLDELRIAALQARIDADLALGRHREVIGELQALTAEYPLQEGFCSRLMVALYRSDRQADALRAYQRTRIYLNEELGLEPSPATREMEQRVIDQDPTLDLEIGPTIRRLVVVVTDVGDPLELAQVGAARRDEIVAALGSTVLSSIAPDMGLVFAQRGTAYFSCFDAVDDAIEATESIMRLNERTSHPVRVGIDVGEAETTSAGVVVGPPVARAAALVAAAHPGQVVISDAAQSALSASNSKGWQVKALGSHRLGGIETAEPVYQLGVNGRLAVFPSLRTDLSPPGLPGIGHGIHGYELRQLIASDPWHQTYRAYQTALGREVAMRVVAADVASDPSFVRSFEVESQMVARLEHPNIVPLLDYWRSPDGAFLVTSWMRGGTLRDRLAGQLDRDLSRDIIAQIAGALQTAHRSGVTHGSVDPSHVLLDTADNAYLGFLGLGRPPGGDSRPTVEEDITGLRALMNELGEDLEHRTAGSVAQLMQAAGLDDRGRDDFTGLTPARNPYKGLAAFAEADAGDFFGRSGVVTSMLARLAEAPLLTVVGPSGIGKSSAVRAGLIPELRRGALPGSEAWFITDMYPGRFPFDELATALTRVATNPIPNPDAELRSDDRGLSRVVARMLPEGGQVLLVIDQFEELFAIADPATRDAFLHAIVSLIAVERPRARVVITLRADYLEPALRHPVLGPVLRGSDVLVGPPTPGERYESIVKPAERAGVRYEPGLVERTLAETEDEPGSLPLLQYSLTELFDSRGADEITTEDYERSGGVLGALARRAEATYLGLDSEARDATEQIFLRLISVDPSGRDARRRVLRSEFEHLGLVHDTVESVLDAFGKSRLLTFDREPTTRGSTVEVAHEAIFTNWSRLEGWIADRREDLLLARRLRETASEWSEHEEDDAYLLGEGRLIQFETWADEASLPLSDRERQLLDRSRQRVDRQSRLRRRTRNLITSGFALAAMISGVLWLDSSRNARIAESRELAASATGVLDSDPGLGVMLAVKAAERDLGPSAASALHETLARSREVAFVPIDGPISEGGLWASLSPDGQLLAVGGSVAARVIVWDLSNPETPLWEKQVESGMADHPSFTVDGTGLVTIANPFVQTPPGGQRGLTVFDAMSGDEVGFHSVPDCFGPLASIGGLIDLSQPLYGMRLIDCGSGDADIWETGRLDLETGDFTPLTATPTSAECCLPTMSADGRYVAIGLGGQVKVIDTETGELFTPGTTGLATLSSDGTRLLTGGLPQPLQLWDVQSGEIVRELPGNGWDGSFGVDSSTIVVGGDSRLSVVELGGDQSIRDERIIGPLVSGWMAVGAHGSRAVSVNETGATVFELEPPIRGEVATWAFGSALQNPEINDYQTFEAGENVGRIFNTTAALDEGVSTLVDLTDLSEILAVPSVASGALSPDGRFYATQTSVGVVDGPNGQGDLVEWTQAGPVEIHDLETGNVVTMQGVCGARKEVGAGADGIDTDLPCASGHVDWATWFEFSPDGSMLAMSGVTSGVVMWDPSTGEMLWSHPEPAEAHISFSPTGTQLAASGDEELFIFDSSSGEVLERPSFHGWWLAFTPGGDRIYTADGDVMRAYDTTSWEEVETFRLTVEAERITMSPDGRYAMTYRFGGAEMWDLETGALAQGFLPGEDVLYAEFLDDSTVAFTTAGVGEVLVMTIDPAHLLEIARSRVARGFTESECATYRLDPCPTLEELKSG